MIDAFYLPPKPAIIFPKEPEIIRPGDPRFGAPAMLMGGFGVKTLSNTRRRSGERIVTAWTFRTGSISGDVGRITNINLQGWNGASWSSIDNWATGILSASTTYTRNSANFTNSTDYLDYRLVFTLSANANTFCQEVQLLTDAMVDLTEGCTPTSSAGGGPGDPAKTVDNNNATQWPDSADVSNGVTLEFNIL